MVCKKQVVKYFFCLFSRRIVLFYTAAGGRVPAGPPTKAPGAGPLGGLADVDPDNVPANMKVEGQDWFAL